MNTYRHAEEALIELIAPLYEDLDCGGDSVMDRLDTWLPDFVSRVCWSDGSLSPGVLSGMLATVLNLQ